MRIIEAIAQEHSEEAAFLWLLRDRSVIGPRFRLKDLIRLDARIDAHLDGLRFADEDGWEILRADATAHDEPGEVFASGVLAFESGRLDRIDVVLDLAGANPELLRALVSALGWMHGDLAQPFIDQFLVSESLVLRRIGLAAAAIRRINPGKALEASIEDTSDPALTARALRAIGELGLWRMLSGVTPHLDAEDPDIRFSAAWSAALLGEPSAVPVLGSFALEEGPRAERACEVGLRCLDTANAYKAHGELAEREELSRLAVAAVGTIGDPALMDWLIERMQTPALTRLAGEAFVFITGVDLRHPALEGSAPDGFEAGPNDDPDDDNVTPDPDEHLPWPAPAKVQQWWSRYGSEFRPGTRYLLGSPITPNWLWEVLRSGRQEQRAAAALELALATRGPVFEVRAPGFRQQASLRAR